MTRIDVTLRNDKAEQFERIKQRMEERRGHSMTRVQVLAELMAEHEDDQPIEGGLRN